MSIAGLLLAATLVLPLAMVAACLSARFRARVISYLALAPLPAVLAAIVSPGGNLVLFPIPFRIILALDLLGAILLGGAAVLWSAAGAYASFYMGSKPSAARFAIWWLLTLTGSLGVFVVADIASFYLVFTLVSLAAYGLITQDETPRAERAGAIYVALAIVGEACLLLAFVMLASGSTAANPLIVDVVATIRGSPLQDGIVFFIIAGFALKMGLVPLHVWLPLAHPVAPMPASAVLSGVVVKAGVIGLIRFLPFEAGLPHWGGVLTAVGLVTTFYGVGIGVTQTRPKTILAYSTVSQMGLLAAMLGIGLANADGDAPSLVAYYAMHHTLVKGALFLAVGIVAATGGARLRPVLIVTAILALSLGGLPLTSGALAKLASRPMLGYGLAGQALTLAAAGTTLLMLHFLTVLSGEASRDSGSRAPTGEVIPWLVVSVLSVFLPWVHYPHVTGETVWNVLHIASVWKVAWPMGLGAVAAVFLIRLRGRVPSVPEGDIIVLADASAPAIQRLAVGIERSDGLLRRWAVAGSLLLTLAIMLGGALMHGH